MSHLSDRLACIAASAMLALAGATVTQAASAFSQSNLVSDIPGLAQNTDSNLKNPWGISFAPTSPFWVSNQVSGNSTLYGANGQAVPLVVSTPPFGPTGQVFNSSGQFAQSNGNAAVFIFATLGGTIDAWNGGTTAEISASAPNAVFTGLALANNGSGNFLYAANAAGGTINVFNSSFQATTLAGNFVDPHLPAGYSPYNVQTIGSNIYVTYAQGRTTGAGLGVVSVFDTDGRFIRELIPAGGVLDSPWGITLAPAGFGSFGGDLLVGNFGNGQINAFNPQTGAFLGVLTDSQGNPIVNDGLWALEFRSAPGFNPNSLYFDAGIQGEQHGLFGTITPTPEPASLLAAALGLGVLAAGKRLRSRRG